MGFESFIDSVGEPQAAAIGGIIIGVFFGYFGQRSRFCLRAAAVQFSRGEIGDKLAIWLIVFSIAVLGTQGLILTDQIGVGEARQLALPGSMSGAIMGGLLFGTGMVLARGCSSRMLVLSANGNLRALLTGLIFAVAAQSSLHGVLSPVRSELASIWMLAPQDLEIFSLLGTGPEPGFLVGFLCLGIGLWTARRYRIAHKIWLGATLVGATIPAAWYFTFNLSALSFDPVQVESLSFTGPSADTLMLVVSQPSPVLDFDVGLIPGVFLGSFIAAYLAKELKLEGFSGGHSMKRYIVGAACMGFGGMLAGGCAVGAGVTGGSVFAITAWTTLFMMWFSASVTDLLVDRWGLFFQRQDS